MDETILIGDKFINPDLIEHIEYLEDEPVLFIYYSFGLVDVCRFGSNRELLVNVDRLINMVKYYE